MFDAAPGINWRAFRRLNRVVNVGVIVWLLFGKPIEAFGAIVAAGVRAALGEPD